MPLFNRKQNDNEQNELLPVQSDGNLPYNFYDVEAPISNEAEPYYQAVPEVVTSDKVREFNQILKDYKSGKVNLENRIVDNEEWWKGRNWEMFRRKNEKKEEIEPTSAYLFNSLANKHADAMDNFPSPNILAREQNDEVEAQKLSSIIPVVLDQVGFESVYSKVWNYKLKNGTGVYGVFWDSSKLNGLGDISINKADLLNLFWEPGVTDIQDSPYLFYLSLRNNDELESQYPQLKDKLGGKDFAIAEYRYDDTVDTTKKTVVVDCYYKVRQNGSTVLHYCKYVGDTVLYATENEEKLKITGLYDHAKYPFVFDTLFEVEGSPVGFGYIDIAKSPQEYIDRMDKALIENMEQVASPRVAVSNSSGINQEEFMDLKNKVIHFEGTLNDEQFRCFQPNTIGAIYAGIKANKIEELKETTGNRDVSTGGTTAGVTAASAIAAMQEAGSKLSRDMIKASYRAYKEIILLVIELIRQFYDVARQFRILGDNGAGYEYISYSNSGIAAQSQGGIEFNVDVGERIPLFDVEITAEKASPYTKMAQNELMLQFYGNGFFNPQMADQALACLEGMDFDGKQKIIERISQNGTIYQQYIARTQMCLALAQMLDTATGSNYAEQIAAEINGEPAPPFINGVINSAPTNEQLGGNSSMLESNVTKKAKQQTAEATAPR